MQARGLSGTLLGFVGQVSFEELGAQFLRGPETSEEGATRCDLVEVV